MSAEEWLRKWYADNDTELDEDVLLAEAERIEAYVEYWLSTGLQQS